MIGCTGAISAITVSDDSATTDHWGDTLSKTQEQYVNNASKKGLLSMSASAVSVNDSIKNTIETYLALGHAKTRNMKSYSDTALIKSDKVQDKTIVYRNSTNEYLYKIHEALKTPVKWDDLSFKNFTVKVDGNTATATVVEDYKYFLDDEFQTVSNRVKEYTITLENTVGAWNVTSVKTNDPEETKSDFSYTPIDVDKAVSSVLTDKATAQANTLSEQTKTVSSNYSVSSTGLYTWGYNRSAAASYAASWYYRVNSLFGENSGEDCQNFASQCVWAGFGGSSPSAYPAVTGTNGGSSSRIWRHNYYYSTSPYWLGWTWDNVSGFASMVNSESYYSVGPMGTRYLGNLLYADIGDVIDYTYYEDGTPTYSNLGHAMVVTNASGSSGYRSRYSLYIAAHSNSTNSAQQPLTDYCSYPDSQFTTVHIDCANYPS